MGRLPTAAVAAALVLTGCGDAEPSRRDAGASTTVSDTTPSSTTSTDTPGMTTTSADVTDMSVPPEGTDPMDYEGQRYDFGEITDVESRDGVVMVTFNRQQIYTDDGTMKSGKELTEEPVFFGNTDAPYIDDSRKLRTFVLADDAEVLRIEDPIPCASDEFPVDPVWRSISVGELVAGAWEDRLQDTLTFGDDGLVSRVRLSAAC